MNHSSTKNVMDIRYILIIFKSLSKRIIPDLSRYINTIYELKMLMKYAAFH
jgi:hypothetical protein